MNKPRLFISHAAADAALANAVKEEIEQVFANGIDVFCTSSPSGIRASDDWLRQIEENLDSADAVIVLITPRSVSRQWLWFEVGAAWLKGKTGGCKIYPTCVSEHQLADLPSPLDRLQAGCLSDATRAKQFFQDLIQQFQFGNLSALSADNVLRHIPDYGTVDAESSNSSLQILTAPTPDVRVSVNSGYTPGVSGPVFFLAIEVKNYSPVDVYVNSIYIEASDNSILISDADAASGEYWKPKELQPARNVMFRFGPDSLRQFLSRGLICAVAKDEIGRTYRSSQEEFARAIHLLFDYYLKDDEQSGGGREQA